jgi:hypothetical protein
MPSAVSGTQEQNNRVQSHEIRSPQSYNDLRKSGRPELTNNFALSGYENRKHGDIISGMYFYDENGKPVWGTYGVLHELPPGLNKDQVVDFLVEGDYLELVKKLSDDLPQSKKDELEHLQGWRRKLTAETSTEKQEPLVPLVDEAATRPDAGIAITPPGDSDNISNTIAVDNISAIEARRVGPGTPIEELKKMISGHPNHVTASALAEQLHKQANQKS